MHSDTVLGISPHRPAFVAYVIYQDWVAAMFSFNDNEIIWIAQHRILAKLVVIATAILLATYAFLDWIIDPALPTSPRCRF